MSIIFFGEGHFFIADGAGKRTILRSLLNFVDSIGRIDYGRIKETLRF